MNKKHPERNPVHKVEGVVWVDELEGKQLIINTRDEIALRPLIKVLAQTATRQLAERHQKDAITTPEEV